MIDFKKRKNLVVCPVGSPIDKHIKIHSLDFDLTKHWRVASNDRNYDILVVQYGDYVSEDGTYDHLVKFSGNKWKILKQLFEHINFLDWNHIALFDDDLVLDTQTMNSAFEDVNKFEIKLSQISLSQGSESQWYTTRNINGAYCSVTNFVEVMAPFIESNCLMKLKPLFESYNVNHGWGLDLIFSKLFQTNPVVFHDVSMFHPSRPDSGSSYIKTEAFEEMETLFNIFKKIDPTWTDDKEKIIKIYWTKDSYEQDLH